MAVKPTIALEMQFSGSAGAWTDVRSDVLQQAQIRARYGINGGGPWDRVARTGTMSFSMRNDDGNSGGLEGYYSPDHANARSGFDLGIATRLKISYSGCDFYKWSGRLSAVKPGAGKYRNRRTRCDAVDWFDFAAKRRMRLVETAFNQRADQGIATVVSSMDDLPPASSLAQGQDTFPTIFDSTRDERTTVMREIYKLTVSELGYLYSKGDQTTGGVLTFEDRHTRPKDSTSSASFDDTMVKLVPDRSTRNIFNRIKGQANPRETSSAASILFTLRSKPLISPGASTVIEGLFSDPEQRGAIRVGGASMITPASTTDYIMNSASDGTGPDLTGNFTVGASFGGNSVRYGISNDGSQAGYITLLQARGRLLVVKEPTIQEKIDQDSIDGHGESVLRLDMPYQEDPLVVEDAANAILSNWKDPVTLIKGVEFIGNDSDTLMTQGLLREPGDRITITETVTGIDKDYFINGVEIGISPPDIVKFGWILAPAETSQFWILGVVGFSELGQTTVAGY